MLTLTWIYGTCLGNNFNLSSPVGHIFSFSPLTHIKNLCMAEDHIEGLPASNPLLCFKKI